MSPLVVCLFAEFACLALLVPGLTLLRRNVPAKLFVTIAVPVLVTLPLLAAVRLELLPSNFSVTRAMHLLLKVQALAIAFTLALSGASALLGRRWTLGGPVAVSVLAMLLLASPTWGDVLLRLDNKTVQSLAARWLVAPNPLFTVAYLTNYDWTTAKWLYSMTRIGEDFAFAPTSLPILLIAYGAAGLVAAVLAALVRQKGRPAEYLLSPGERL